MPDVAIADHPRFEKAEDFLAALRPSHPFWKADPDSWVFRGHADSTWLLLPSGNRRRALGAYFDRYQGDGYVQPDPLDLGTLIVTFVHSLNRAGYEVPGIGTWGIAGLAGKLMGGRPGTGTDEPIALAQHHGLPTFMLDWTRHSNFAAYFAASETANLPGPLTGDIEVWALNKKLGERTRMYGMLNGASVRLSVSTPPRAANPNLHAQGGLFTFTEYQTQEGGVLRPTNEIVEAQATANSHLLPLPVMHRLRLPQSEAGEVLRLLSFEPVTGGTLFPGVDGVVRDVRDRVRLGRKD